MPGQVSVFVGTKTIQTVYELHPTSYSIDTEIFSGGEAAGS